jgi:hypothetical protein
MAVVYLLNFGTAFVQLELKITELLRLCSQIGIFCEVLRLYTTLPVCVRTRTGRGEVSKSNHYFPLRYIFIDSYAYHKLILLIPQILILI